MVRENSNPCEPIKREIHDKQADGVLNERVFCEMRDHSRRGQKVALFWNGLLMDRPAI
jgi:hypothetical protein